MPVPNPPRATDDLVLAAIDMRLSGMMWGPIAEALGLPKTNFLSNAVRNVISGDRVTKIDTDGAADRYWKGHGL